MTVQKSMDKVDGTFVSERPSYPSGECSQGNQKVMAINNIMKRPL